MSEKDFHSLLFGHRQPLMPSRAGYTGGVTSNTWQHGQHAQHVRKREVSKEEGKEKRQRFYTKAQGKETRRNERVRAVASHKMQSA